MLTPISGILILSLVVAVTMMERTAGEISFFDWHAAIIVLGGVIGALFIAIDARSLRRMLFSIRELFPSTSYLDKELYETKVGLNKMAAAWREGQRRTVLEIADSATTEELQVAADALMRQLSGSVLAERFATIRADYMRRAVPLIEGWDLVGKLAPSFGMVGTVTGMVQLFRNMAESGANLGGAMAMALLATLYGITIGAAVGGPMAARITKQLNERLAQLDLIEKTIAALVEESKHQQATGTGERHGLL